MNPGQRSRLFREVNDRIYELLESTDADLPGEFLCECGGDCGRRVVLSPAAFSAHRETGLVVLSEECSESGFERRDRRARPVESVPSLG